MLEERIVELTEAITQLTAAIEEVAGTTLSQKSSEPATPAEKPTPKRRGRKKKPEPKPEPELESEITSSVDLPTIRRLFRQLVTAHGQDAAVDILQEFGVKTVPEIPEDDYDDVFNRLNEELSQ